MNGIKKISLRRLTSQLINRNSLLNKPSNYELVHIRGIKTTHSQGARDKGSLFGWNLFGKKEEETIEAKEEANEDEAINEWVSVEEEAKPTIVELSQEDKTKIITEEINRIHPDAKEGSDINTLSLDNGKVKFELLTSIQKKLSEASLGAKFDIPDRNLNNMSNVSDIFGFFIHEQDKFDVNKGFAIKEFFDKEETKSIIPTNVRFQDYIPDDNVDNSKIFNKKGKQLDGEYLKFAKQPIPKPSRH